MRRVAWFHLVVETEDEVAMGIFLTVMADAVSRIAQAAALEIPEIKVLDPAEAGQSIPVAEGE